MCKPLGDSPRVWHLPKQFLLEPPPLCLFNLMCTASSTLHNGDTHARRAASRFASYGEQSQHAEQLSALLEARANTAHTTIAICVVQHRVRFVASTTCSLTGASTNAPDERNRYLRCARTSWAATTGRLGFGTEELRVGCTQQRLHSLWVPFSEDGGPYTVI